MAVFEERILGATRLLSVRDFSFCLCSGSMVLGRLWQLCDATFAMMTATAMCANFSSSLRASFHFHGQVHSVLYSKVVNNK